MCILYGNYVDLFECFFNFHGRQFRFVSNFFIDGMCVVALAPVTKTMNGATFDPLVVMLLTSNWYFVLFLSSISATNLSLQYVNSINYMVNYGVGASCGGWLYGWPMTHNMSGLNMALQWHLWASHGHGSSHIGIVFLRGSLLYVPMFISV